MPDAIDGMKELQNKLDAITDDFWKLRGNNSAHATMTKSLYLLIGSMADYPTQRAPKGGGEPYKRTGTAGRSWTDNKQVKGSGLGITGKIGSNIDYIMQLQSAAFQTSYHRETGWITDEKAIKKNKPAIDRMFKRAIDITLERG